MDFIAALGERHHPCSSKGGKFAPSAFNLQLEFSCISNMLPKLKYAKG
jgi:hypothetical protein